MYYLQCDTWLVALEYSVKEIDLAAFSKLSTVAQTKVGYTTQVDEKK